MFFKKNINNVNQLGSGLEVLLRVSQSLSFLDVSNNSLSSAALLSCTKGLRHNCTLTDIKLANAGFAHNSVRALAYLFSGKDNGCGGISKLDISRNFLDEIALHDVAAMMSYRNGLTQLHLSQNFIGNETRKFFSMNR